MRFAVLLALFAVACGEEDSEDPWQPPEPDSNHGYVCEADQNEFPPFSKACRKASDCSALPHVESACGDLVMVGVNDQLSDTFEQFESTCRSLYDDRVACRPEPTRTEDGLTEEDGEIVVDCVEERCTTLVEQEQATGSAGSGG